MIDSVKGTNLNETETNGETTKPTRSSQNYSRFRLHNRDNSRSQENNHEEQTSTQEICLPFPWSYSFRLLGVVVDCGWRFHQHFVELQSKLARRPQAMRKVSGTVWGLESRILAVTAHALLGSVVGYGLATTGSRAMLQTHPDEHARGRTHSDEPSTASWPT